MDALELRGKLFEDAERSWKEFKTTALIKKYLEERDVGVTSLPKTGLLVRRGRGVPVLLRADIDALPFGERVVHACGHDVHTAALAAALPLIEGSVLGVFQPAEEDYPPGAKYIMSNVKEKVGACVAIHVDPDLPLGVVGVREGFVMGSVDLFKVRVKGRSAHTAYPLQGRDALLAAAEVIKEVRRLVSGERSVVVSLARGGEKDNVVCDLAELTGTLRALSDDLREGTIRELRELCERVAREHDLAVEFELVPGGYPPLYNDPSLTRALRSLLIEEFGEDKVVENKVRLSNEDFSYYRELGPCCLVRVGVGGGTLHSESFKAPDGAVEIGKRVYLAASRLGAPARGK